MERQLLEYLPDHMRAFLEMHALLQAEQPTMDQLWADLYAVLDGLYIETAGGPALRRWEVVLGVEAKPTATLEERQFALLARLNENLPYTLNRLHQQLTTLCGPKGYRLAMIAKEYTLQVKVDLGVKSKYGDVEALLERMVPANMLIHLSLLYNTHMVLGRYTHEQLGQYTQRDLREEVISNA